MNTKLLISVLAGLAVLGGCTQEAREKYDAAGEDVGQAAQRTSDAAATDARRSGEVIEQGAENAAEAAENAARNSARAADNAGDEMGIKNAILSAENLDASDLNVEVRDNRVILEGSVPTAEQKKRAGDIAKGVAGQERTVDNQLSVGRK